MFTFTALASLAFLAYGFYGLAHTLRDAIRLNKTPEAVVEPVHARDTFSADDIGGDLSGLGDEIEAWLARREKAL